jgi:hypothetical protein
LKSISPSLENGVVIGGITPVGRVFMATSRDVIPYPVHGRPVHAKDYRMP